MELEDAIDYSKFFSFAPPDLLKIFPPAKVIDAMRVRLDADKAADTHLVVGFQFRDPQDACALEIRRGVAVFHDHLPEHTDAIIATTSAVIYQLLGGQTTPADALQAGDITITGDTRHRPRLLHLLRPTIQGPHQTHRPLIGAGGCWRQWQSAWQSTSQHQPALRRSHWIWHLT